MKSYATSNSTCNKYDQTAGHSAPIENSSNSVDTREAVETTYATAAPSVQIDNSIEIQHQDINFFRSIS